MPMPMLGEYLRFLHMFALFIQPKLGSLKDFEPQYMHIYIF